jgi:hypothetical protein
VNASRLKLNRDFVAFEFGKGWDWEAGLNGTVLRHIRKREENNTYWRLQNSISLV